VVERGDEIREEVFYLTSIVVGPMNEALRCEVVFAEESIEHARSIVRCCDATAGEVIVPPFESVILQKDTPFGNSYHGIANIPVGITEINTL
jgi:hypothetical protein